MSKAITGLVFLALVFGAYSTASTIISGAATTVFDSTSTTDTGKTFSPDLSAVGPGSAATTQYLYGLTAFDGSGGSTLDVNTWTVDTSALTVTEGDYGTAAATLTTTSTADPLTTKVLTANEYYCLITLELATDTNNVYAYWWKGGDTTDSATVTAVTLYTGTDTNTNGVYALLGNAWYAADTFWVVVITQTLASSVYSDTGFAVVGLDISSTPAAASGTFSMTLGTAVTSTATGAIEAMGGCETATACTTINVLYTDGTDFIVQPLTDGATGTAVTLTLPTDDADGTTSTYKVAGTVGLSSTPLHLLSRNSNDGTTSTYTLVAYQGTTATNAYYITPGTTATGAITVYWSGIANSNTEPSIITTYTSASGNTYDYVYTTVDATTVGKSYTFASNFDNAPSVFVDASGQLWVGYSEGSSSITTLMVAPLGSSILMSAIAFVSMIVMTLFMF